MATSAHIKTHPVCNTHLTYCMYVVAYNHFNKRRAGPARPMHVLNRLPWLQRDHLPGTATSERQWVSGPRASLNGRITKVLTVKPPCLRTIIPITFTPCHHLDALSRHLPWRRAHLVGKCQQGATAAAHVLFSNTVSLLHKRPFGVWRIFMVQSRSGRTRPPLLRRPCTRQRPTLI
jgi:hypothetical protein